MANSILDFLTGGNASAATNSEEQGLQALQNVQAPTAAQLTLPELQQYVNAGLMTPAQMQAYLQQNNALATENTSQTGTQAQEAALNQLANVANAGAAGTPTEQAQIAQAEAQANTNLAGQRGAIEQAAEARGTPGGLLQAALEQQNAGQDAQNVNQADLQAQSQAYQNALTAMANEASGGQALQGQQNTQANTIAAAQNAMQQFNAANQQAASAANQSAQQQANAYNTQNQQNVANQNTGLANQQTEYNAQVPETVYNNALGKASAEAGQGNTLANTETGQGQQMAGLYSGILGSAAGAFAPGMSGAAVNQVGFGNGPPPGVDTSQYAPTNHAKGGVISPVPAHYDCGDCMAHGGLCMKHGGKVPGHAKFPGDSLLNDNVHANLSPGEAVIPRTTVQQNPAAVQALLNQANQGQQQPQMGHHPEDVAALLAAMRKMRGVR